MSQSVNPFEEKIDLNHGKNSPRYYLIKLLDRLFRAIYLAKDKLSLLSVTSLKSNIERNSSESKSTYKKGSTKNKNDFI